MKLSKRLAAYLRRVVRDPIEELSHAQRMLRYSIKLARHGYRQLMKDRASEMAAALTYRTIFSLVPVVMLSVLVFRSFAEPAEVQDWVQKTMRELGWSSLRIEQQPPAGGPPRDQKVRAEVRSAVDQQIHDLIRHAWNLNLSQLGAAGVALFIWAALALLVTVEDCFNTIYNAPEGRGWPSRVTIYWAVLTLGPVLLFVSFYYAGQAVRWSSEAAPIASGLMNVATRLAGFAATWLLLLVLYMLMPNTTVRFRPALAGSFVSAILWEMAKWGFKLYVTKAVPYSLLYGSLALIPLFLFWLYLTWLIVLFGLELAATLQSLHGHELNAEQDIPRPSYQDRFLGDPQWVVPLMAVVGHDFQKGAKTTIEQLSQRLQLPADTVAAMGDYLEQAGLLHRLQSPEDDVPSFVLSKPPEQIPVAQLLEMGRSITSHNAAELARQPGWAFLGRLVEAQTRAAANATLANVLSNGNAEADNEKDTA